MDLFLKRSTAERDSFDTGGGWYATKDEALRGTVQNRILGFSINLAELVSDANRTNPASTA